MIATARCPACGEASSVSSLDGGQVVFQCGGNASSYSDAFKSSGSSSGPGSNPHGPVPVADAPLPGRVGKYRIDRPVGTGGFGTVYLAHDDKLERRVALQIASPPL